MKSTYLSKENLNKVIPTIAIIVSIIMILQWRSYEKTILNNSKVKISEIIEYDELPSTDKVAKINLLEKMAIAERSKIKVMVEHDNSPLTKTYPMILDATNSFDPDIGDEVQFVWKQISATRII